MRYRLTPDHERSTEFAYYWAEATAAGNDAPLLLSADSLHEPVPHAPVFNVPDDVSLWRPVLSDEHALFVDGPSLWKTDDKLHELSKPSYKLNVGPGKYLANGRLWHGHSEDRAEPYLLASESTQTQTRTPINRASANEGRTRALED